MTEKQEINVFDKIRADADEKRKARIEEKNKTDEFFTRMKNGAHPLDGKNQRIKGDLK